MESPLPSGAYEGVCGKFAVLQFNTCNSKFERNNIIKSNGEKKSFTLKQVEEAVRNAE